MQAGEIEVFGGRSATQKSSVVTFPFSPSFHFNFSPRSQNNKKSQNVSSTPQLKKKVPSPSYNSNHTIGWLRVQFLFAAYASHLIQPPS